MNQDEEKVLMKEFVERWKRVGPILEEMRNEEIRNTDTCLAIRCLDDAFEALMLHSQVRVTSGLVEQQKYFLRYYNK